MGFYVTAENPDVIMKENHNTYTCEYIMICQDGLYIASTTPEKITYVKRQIQDHYLSTR